MKAFMHNLKCAGHSVTKWLEDNNVECENVSLLNKSNYDLFSIVSDVQDLEWSFGIVRNSYDRAISHYLFEIKRAQEVYDYYGQDSHIQIKEVKDIDNFIDWFNYKISNWPEYMVPQQERLEGVDLILHYENLDEDFKQVQEVFDCHVPLPFENKYSNFEEKQTIATPEVISLIEDHFADDILLYEHENPFTI